MSPSSAASSVPLKSREKPSCHLSFLSKQGTTLSCSLRSRKFAFLMLSAAVLIEIRLICIFEVVSHWTCFPSARYLETKRSHSHRSPGM